MSLSAKAPTSMLLREFGPLKSTEVNKLFANENAPIKLKSGKFVKSIFVNLLLANVPILSISSPMVCKLGISVRSTEERLL